jgi:PiT family inorganic phosphate transporter
MTAQVGRHEVTAIAPEARAPMPWVAGGRLTSSPVLVVAGLLVLALLGRVESARLPIGLTLVAVLAFANGANDVSKAVATLVGSGVASYRRALAWGSVTTLVGALISAATGSALVATFSTKVLDTTGLSFALSIGFLVGTLGWVLLATKIGMPVATTHALTGSIVVAGAFSLGLDRIHWDALGGKVVKPLLLSPFIGAGAAIVLALAFLVVRAARRELRAVHWLSSGATAAARGMNDAPKIAALGILVLEAVRHTPSHRDQLWIAFLVAAAMTLGSWVAGRRVTRTLGERVTVLDDRDGTAANIVTATLVTLAAERGLPVSTTHVSSGAIIGVGAARRQKRLNRRVVGEMVLAWIVTIPAAGAIATLAWLVFEALS